MQYHPYIMLMFCPLASSPYQLTACRFYKPASYFHTVISELPSESNMLKFLTWLLSLSSLFALSRPGNGALLPPPGARSTPILKRDDAQPVRRQGCAAPGLEVDQEQVTQLLPTLTTRSLLTVGMSEKKALHRDMQYESAK